jgi:DNA-binding response OmpR family regulator
MRFNSRRTREEESEHVTLECAPAALTERGNTKMAKRLLVVEDGERLLRALAVTLLEEGYEVATARNGAEALVSISEKLPDLIISDILMPVMDGIALARLLRANARTAPVPIIFLTTQTEIENSITALRSGVNACIGKPFDPDDLLAAVAGILNN